MDWFKYRETKMLFLIKMVDGMLNVVALNVQVRTLTQKKMRLTLQEKLVKIKIQSLLFIIKTAKLHILIATAKILARQRIRNSFTES